MRRGLIVNVVIVALALGTLGVVWATRDAPTTSQLSARKNKLFRAWDKAAVTRIRLRRDSQEVELVRDASVGVEGDFRIVKPWSERADIATVNSLLGSLDLATALRAADGVDRKRAGLEPPALQISLEMSGKMQIVKLGGAAPAPSGARYMEVTDGNEPARVVLVSAGLVSELDVPLEKLREPRLLSVEKRELVRLTITHATGKVELVQRKPTSQLHAPGAEAFFVRRGGTPELADRDFVTRVLTALSRLVASELVEPELARAAIVGDATALRVELERRAKAGPVLTLSLGGSCPAAPDQKLVLREEPGAAPRAGCVPQDIVEALRVDEGQASLGSPFLARMDEVERISVSGEASQQRPARAQTRLDLVRKDAAFHMSSPSDAEVSLEAGNERISAIVRAHATRPSPALVDASLWQGSGWVEVDLVSQEDRLDSERISLGRPRADGSRCMKRELDEVVLCVDAEAAKAFLPDPTLLRGSTVTSFAAADVTQFSVESPTLRQTIVRRDDGSYALQEPSGFTHDGALVADAVRTLGSLRSERWVAAKPDASHGLETPLLRARISMSSRIVHELLVGSPTGGGYFARLAADPGVFVLARSTVALLQAPLIDRSLSPLTTEKLAQVELARGPRRVKLVKNGDSFTSNELSPARAAQLLETLGSLRADFTVHLGPERPNERLRPASSSVTFTATTGERYVLRVGARDTIDGASVAYVRLDSVDATFALAASTVTALQDF